MEVSACSLYQTKVIIFPLSLSFLISILFLSFFFFLIRFKGKLKWWNCYMLKHFQCLGLIASVWGESVLYERLTYWHERCTTDHVLLASALNTIAAPSRPDWSSLTYLFHAIWLVPMYLPWRYLSCVIPSHTYPFYFCLQV